MPSLPASGGPYLPQSLFVQQTPAMLEDTLYLLCSKTPSTCTVFDVYAQVYMHVCVIADECPLMTHSRPTCGVAPNTTIVMASTTVAELLLLLPFDTRATGCLHAVQIAIHQPSRPIALLMLLKAAIALTSLDQSPTWQDSPSLQLLLAQRTQHSLTAAAAGIAHTTQLLTGQLAAA